MHPLCLSDWTWTEVEALDPSKVVAILPTGAVEAHGPHLPLLTDGLISEAMAAAGAKRLAARGLVPLILPTLHYSAAPFAAAFPGTISIRAETMTALVIDIGRQLAASGISTLAIANSHLDPAHLGSLYEAIRALRDAEGLEVLFPDITRKPWASRLSAEFKSGACHAGQYESSVVLAARPDLVRDETRTALEANPASLSRAILDGKTDFSSAGGPRAYFGDPSAATAEEGQATIELLGQMIDEVVVGKGVLEVG